MYVCMSACICIHSFMFCSYVFHLMAGMSGILMSSLSLAVRSYFAGFFIGIPESTREKQLPHWRSTAVTVYRLLRQVAGGWNELDVVLRAQRRRRTSRQRVVTQSVGATGVYIVSVRPGNSDEGQWNPRGPCESRQDSDGFRVAALALGPRGRSHYWLGR